MIRVGIMSMQRIANYGSFLQAYGLKCILQEFGCKVEFVDYHPGKTLIPSDGGKGLLRKIVKGYEAISYQAPFKAKIQYIRYKRNYATNYYPYLGISENRNYSPDVDILIIGSDEVFNCVQDNTNVGFSLDLFGKGNKAKRLVTYAASFGNTTEDMLVNYNIRDLLKECLDKFDAISVRDKNSGAIIENLTGKLPEYHFDPVLIYDFIGGCKEIPTEVPISKYMILYGYSGRFNKEESEQIQSYAKMHRLKVACIGGVQSCCDEFIDCNPFEVIAYFQHAECIVTDTFHGVILSIITHKRFTVFVRKSGYGNSEKITDLLERLGLGGRRIWKEEDLEVLLNQSIDYHNIDALIERERKHTREYLIQQINLHSKV